MNLSSGYPLSLVKNGLPFDYKALQKELNIDVLIIGGGISGALVAYHLINAGVACAVIDGRTIGLGSTCASTSLLQYEIDTPLSELQYKVKKAHAVAAFKLCSQSIDKLEKIALKINFTGFQRKKSLYFTTQKKDIQFLKKEFEIRKQNGFDVRFLDEEQIKTKFGFTANAAILSAQAADADAYSFTHALLQYSIKKGVQVYDRTKAVKISHLKNKVKIQTNQGYLINANKIVYATGYESVNYIDKKITSLNSTYAICSEQINKNDIELDTKTLFWNTADPYLYMRSTADNRIIIGGRDEDFYNPVKRDKLINKKAKQLAADFTKLFPEAIFKTEFSWTGTFSSTKDGLPFIGEYKKLQNSYFALGFGGNGITFSLIAAEMITDLINGKKNKHLDIFSFDRI